VIAGRKSSPETRRTPTSHPSLCQIKFAGSLEIRLSFSISSQTAFDFGFCNHSQFVLILFFSLFPGFEGIVVLLSETIKMNHNILFKNPLGKFIFPSFLCFRFSSSSFLCSFFPNNSSSSSNNIKTRTSQKEKAQFRAMF